jgi:hypothetical protein
MDSAKRSDDRPSDGGGLSQDDLDPSRREILGKIGQLAYVAPALALLAEPKAVSAYGMRPKNGYGDMTEKTATGSSRPRSWRRFW